MEAQQHEIIKNSLKVSRNLFLQLTANRPQKLPHERLTDKESFQAKQRNIESKSTCAAAILARSERISDSVFDLP
jgi:hypothetical protein